MSFLKDQMFLQFGVPLLTVALTIFVKYVSRNDRHSGFRKEDLAVGLDMSVTALLIFITGSAHIASSMPSSNPPQDLVDQIASVPWILMGFVIGMWGISTLVRKLGWEDDDKLKIFWGIVVPGLFGLLTLLFAVNWIK
ncbi:MAG: hypothetical protein VX100_21795 [Pseudomonadota bacterium]|nr:hypothetical protein [Pseudomonadota bacterium]